MSAGIHAYILSQIGLNYIVDLEEMERMTLFDTCVLNTATMCVTSNLMHHTLLLFHSQCWSC